MSAESKSSSTPLAWLDNSSAEGEEDKAAESQLRLLNSSFKRLRSEDEWSEYLKSQNANTSITLIISGQLGKKLVPQLQSSAQISAIYIYCSDKATHEGWSKAYEKVKSVHTEFSSLMKALRSHSDPSGAPVSLVKIKRTIVTTVSETEPALAPAPASDENPSVPEQHPPVTEENEPVPEQNPPAPEENQTAPEQNPAVTEENQALLLLKTYQPDMVYIVSDSCFEFLSRIPSSSQDIADYCSFYQKEFVGDPEAVGFIKYLEEKYEPDRAVKWLLDNPFIRALIENSFNFQSIELMMNCRRFINNIQNLLQKHRCDSTIQCYRCESMPNEQLRRLKESNDGITSMKYFLLANTDRTKALEAEPESDSADKKRVLFTIEANPHIPGVKSFARVSAVNSTDDLGGVLFAIGSLFKITEISEETNGLVNIKMTSCTFDQTNITKQLCDQIKGKYIDSEGAATQIGFARFLAELGNEARDKLLSDEGERMLHSCLEHMPENEVNRYHCYDGLGRIEMDRGNYEHSLVYFTKSLELKKPNFEANSPNLIEDYRNLSQAYMQSSQWPEALRSFEQYSHLLKHHHGEDCLDLIPCYTNMAVVHERSENYKEELCYSYRALAIMLKNNIDNESNYATVYSNIGVAHVHRGAYHLALAYFQTALQQKLKFCSEIHPQIAASYEKIAIVYSELSDIPQARSYYERAASIYREFDPDDDPNVKRIQEAIRNLSVDS